jgi:hypothetical protein
MMTESIIATFFASIRRITGSEANLQCALASALVSGGIDAADIELEMRRPNMAGNIDLAIKRPGEFLPKVAVELKGGAYSHRNALVEEIDPSGYCSDLQKLASLSEQGVETWFVCVDMVALGRAIVPQCVPNIWEHCRRHGHNFAYFSQDEKTCQVGQVNSGELRVIELPLSAPSAQPNAHIRHVLGEAVRQEGIAAAHERNIQGALYRQFVAAGWSPSCIDVEMFSGFRKDNGGKATKRTDMAVFDPKVNGRFNLHLNGQLGNSNDAHKAQHLMGLFEIKGGAGFSKKSAAAKRKDIVADLIKLSEQRYGMIRNGADQPEAWMIVCDGREGLQDDILQDIIEPFVGLDILYYDPILRCRFFCSGSPQRDSTAGRVRRSS